MRRGNIGEQKNKGTDKKETMKTDEARLSEKEGVLKNENRETSEVRYCSILHR